MQKKLISFLMALIMLVSLFATQLSAFAADSGLTVLFNNGNNAATSNQIVARYKITNNTSAAVNLSDIKIKYYYTIDGEKAQTFYCDNAGMNLNVAPYYVDATSKVKGSFVKMSSPTSNADYYMEVGFSSDAGSLPVGATIEVQTRAAKSDWSNYNQSNDKSYMAAGSYVANPNIEVSMGGIIPQQDPTISPTSSSFTQGAASDISVALTPNNNTFKGITGLTSGSQFSVSGNTVTLKASYLNTLAVGTTTLTFDFGVTNNPKLALTINPPVIVPGLTVTAGTATLGVGETAVIPVKFSDVAKAGKVGTCNFYASYDSSIVDVTSVTAGDIVKNAAVNFSSSINNGQISFLFLDNTIGSELIDTDGVFANITVKGKAAGTSAITLKAGAFGDGNMSKIATVKLENGSVVVKGTTPVDPTISATTASFDKYTPADVTVTITPNGNTFKGITGLTTSNYTVSGNTVTISKSYLSTLAVGTKALTFDFGVTNNPVLTVTVKDSTPVGPTGFAVSVGKVTGAVGDTVTVPVKFANVAKAGSTGSVGTCNFYLLYDATKLQAVSVAAGSIVPGAAVNFSSSISNGTISVLFLDNTIGSQLVSTDGDFAVLTFKVLSSSSAPLTFKAGGAFGDGNFSKISDVTLATGSVN